MNLALFDFDGTITKKETISEFLRFCIGDRHFIFAVLKLSPIILGYFSGLIGNQEIKERLLSETVGGLQESFLVEKGQEFAKKRLPSLIRPKALERIRWHKERGDKIVLVSASLVYYLRPWADIVGIEDVIGVELEIEDGRVTGNLLGTNCYGSEKVRRVKELLDISNFDEIYAYGDSRGDKEMLALANYPFFRPFR